MNPLRPLLLVVGLLLATPARATNETVRMTTVFGNFEVELCTEVSAACPGVAPNTVANFLHYVDEGRYPSTLFIHRRGSGIGGSPPVIQSGGYWIDFTPPPSTEVVQAFAPISLEIGAGLTNVRGTIAMARSTQPDTATSQWFINLVDNPDLDHSATNDGYAVFGKVVSGLDVVDAIGALTIYDGGGAFGELPLLDSFPVGEDPVPYLVYLPRILRAPEPGRFASAAGAALALAVVAWRRRS